MLQQPQNPLHPGVLDLCYIQSALSVLSVLFGRRLACEWCHFKPMQARCLAAEQLTMFVSVLQLYYTYSEPNLSGLTAKNLADILHLAVNDSVSTSSALCILGHLQQQA